MVPWNLFERVFDRSQSAFRREDDPRGGAEERCGPERIRGGMNTSAGDCISACRQPGYAIAGAHGPAARRMAGARPVQEPALPGRATAPPSRAGRLSMLHPSHAFPCLANAAGRPSNRGAAREVPGHKHIALGTLRASFWPWQCGARLWALGRAASRPRRPPRRARHASRPRCRPARHRRPDQPRANSCRCKPKPLQQALSAPRSIFYRGIAHPPPPSPRRRSDRKTRRAWRFPAPPGERHRGKCGRQ